jgi:hypothetical protein
MSQKKRGSKAQQREAVANTNHIKEACRILGSESLATFKDVAYEAACVSARKNVKTAASTISGPGKRAARQFADALHRMEIALKNPYLAHDLRAGLLLDVAGVQGLRARPRGGKKGFVDVVVPRPRQT